MPDYRRGYYFTTRTQKRHKKTLKDGFLERNKIQISGVNFLLKLKLSPYGKEALRMKASFHLTP